MAFNYFRVQIIDKAKVDIKSATEYYEQVSAGLGIRFYLEIRSAIKLLGKNPHFQIRHKNVRCLPLKKFPFIIHFTIDETAKRVVIYAVLHTSMNPSKWPKPAG